MEQRVDSFIKSHNLGAKAKKQIMNEIQKINSGRYRDYYPTEDTKYKAGVKYYVKVDNEYVLLVEGTDYNVGDDIVGNVYNQLATNVSYVVTEKGTFTNEGLRIQQVDETGETIISDTSGLFNEVGVTIQKVSNGVVDGGKPIFFSGYVVAPSEYFEAYEGQTITATQNIIVDKWLVIGDKSRFEEYEENGKTKTGVFPI